MMSGIYIGNLISITTAFIEAILKSATNLQALRTIRIATIKHKLVIDLQYYIALFL